MTYDTSAGIADEHQVHWMNTDCFITPLVQRPTLVSLADSTSEDRSAMLKMSAWCFAGSALWARISPQIAPLSVADSTSED